MTKPSSFILNSDYLALAQVDNQTYTVNVAGGTLAQNGYTEQNFDFTTSSQSGAIDRIVIKNGSNEYLLGAYMRLEPSWNTSYTDNVAGFLQVFRTSSTNIRAQFMLQNFSSGSASYPAMTFTIKVSRFLPPNLF